ncbi:MAG: exodeoxyribonuclease I [Phycisphaerales bacterium]|nr:exodeoxyribonuclease I [Phycisphaerales bacterium]
MAGTFLFYDFETDGVDSRCCRPTQFACIRTDMDLNPVTGPEGKGIVRWCQPPVDRLPTPEATLITGVTPQHCENEGVRENVFFREIHTLLNAPGTISLGWNTLRFDDDVCRFGFWRNFLDSYTHGYQAGCRAWDLIDLTRACYAMRPDGIEWPRRDDGTPTFKLDRLAPANKIEHGEAHDALADVRATIAFGRILKEMQPKLWAWGLKLTDRHFVESLLGKGTPLLHSSARIPAKYGCTTLVHIIGKHPRNKREYIAWDLRQDPTDLLAADAETIAARTFVRQDDLPKGVERFRIKGIKSNRSPFLTPGNPEMLKTFKTDRIELNVDACMKHYKMFTDDPAAADSLAARIEEVYQPSHTSAADVDDALYDGFVGKQDEKLRPAVHTSEPDSLRDLTGRFHDRRLADLLLHYRGRNHPDTLDEAERSHWRERCANRLMHPPGRGDLAWPEWLAHVQTLRSEEGRSDHDRHLLEAVEDWGRELAESQGLAPICS